MSTIQFSVNGIHCKVDESLPRDTTLNAYLRYYLHLPGTKAMCHEGGCGSCVVIVRARRYPSGKVEIFTVNTCLVLIFSCHGWEISTVEDIGNRCIGYSDVQKRIVAFNGSQCGYCTPGWVMQLTSLLHKDLTTAELEKSFGSNTCRCTGYRGLLDTIQSFGSDVPAHLCQKLNDIEDLRLTACVRDGKICQRKCSVSSDWSVIEDLKIDHRISLDFGKNRFFKVFDEQDIFDVLHENGDDSYMFVDGNTGKGLVETFVYPRVLIDISDVESLKGYQFDQNLVLGANLAIQDCITLFQHTVESRPEFHYLSEFVTHLEKVAHIPVRKIGSLAGNLMYKRAIPTYQSDLFLLFSCVGAVMTVRDSKGKMETLTMAEFLHYDMRGKLMVNIELPPLSDSHILRTYKIMPRNQNALAIVNAAFLIKLNPEHIITSATITFGNIDPNFIYAERTEQAMIGSRVFDNKELQRVVKVLEDEIKPVPIEGEAPVEARKKLALGLFYKFILNICPRDKLLPKYSSGGELFHRPISSGRQDYQTHPTLFPLNKPVDKLEGPIQSSGEARYVNDLPPQPREVFGAFVLSTVHSGQVDTIDATKVLAIDGVIAIYTSNDIPGVNSFTFPGIQLQTENEEILATEIKFYGQPIAILVAISEELAAKSAKFVEVTYKKVSKDKPILTIDEAKKISSRTFPGPEVKAKSKGTDIKKVVKGSVEIEAQYHYYLEPISCVVIPVDNMLEVYDSTQWMDLTQISVARCLGICESEVIVKVRRIGGGFGGKLSRNVQAATACAIVAKKLDRPCRFILPIQTNLTIVGKRLPCQCNYEVGVDDNGKIQYLEASIIEDNGWSQNENILSYTSDGFPNCYNTDTWSYTTSLVLTDLPSNTFARAPGDCEAITCVEHIMEHIAFAVNKDPTSVRNANMRTEDNDVPELIEVLKKDADYDKRHKEIQQFNKSNRWMKKAISINVMLFPVVYYGNYSALVSIYRGDGTVTVTTGGIEMGQGLNTKAAQVCAYELGVSLECVKIIPNVSFVAANNVFSGSSITTESVCYAIIQCCKIIKERLAPIVKAMPNAPWKDIIKKASDDQIDLTGKFMMADTDKNVHDYSAFAVAIIETRLDVLTGRFQIDRADILEDVGISANPKLDVGQVEGGYIQGIGYFTSEKLVFDVCTGRLLTNRSLTYHVPLCLDIPVEFNVKLRYNYKNPKGVLGSKTCGEMGMCTAHGVTHALRMCIMESRKDSGYDANEWIYISVPYDTESILKALAVKPEEFLITK